MSHTCSASSVQAVYRVLGLALLLCTATGLWTTWMICQQSRHHTGHGSHFSNAAAGPGASVTAVCAAVDENNKQLHGSSRLGFHERPEISQLELHDHTFSYTTPMKRLHTGRKFTISQEDSPQKGGTCMSATLPAKLQRRGSELYMQAGSVHVIKPLFPNRET